jgi:hypothetical protein
MKVPVRRISKPKLMAHESKFDSTTIKAQLSPSTQSPGVEQKTSFSKSVPVSLRADKNVHAAVDNEDDYSDLGGVDETALRAKVANLKVSNM